MEVIEVNYLIRSVEGLGELKSHSVHQLKTDKKKGTGRKGGGQGQGQD